MLNKVLDRLKDDCTVGGLQKALNGKGPLTMDFPADEIPIMSAMLYPRKANETVDAYDILLDIGRLGLDIEVDGNRVRIGNEKISIALSISNWRVPITMFDQHYFRPTLIALFRQIMRDAGLNSQCCDEVWRKYI